MKKRSIFATLALMVICATLVGAEPTGGDVEEKGSGTFSSVNLNK